MHPGLGLENVSLQLAPSVGRACVLASATTNHDEVELLPPGVHQKDRHGGGTSCTKASPLLPQTHRRCRHSASTQGHTLKRGLHGKDCRVKRDPRGF